MLQCLCSILLLQLVEVKLLSATPIEYMRGLSLRKGHKRGKTGKANIGIFLGYHLKSRLCGGNAYLVEHGMKYTVLLIHRDCFGVSCQVLAVLARLKLTAKQSR